MSPDVTPRFKAPRKKPKKAGATQRCDAIFSRLVRSRGRCEVEGCDKTELQCAHGFSRQYRAVRWDERNAFCLCKSHHFWYTPRPIQWEDWMRARIGDALYDELRELAKNGKNPKLPDVLASLKVRAEELGIAA